MAACSAFDASATSFALVSADSRIRVWDCSSGSLRGEYAEPSHLVVKYTCVAWAPPGAEGAPKKKGKRPARSQSSVLALGTEIGFIVIWDLARGEVARRLGANKEGTGVGPDGHTRRVNDLCFNAAGTRLYSCSDDKHVIEWDLLTGAAVGKFQGAKHALKRLALCPPDEEEVIVASSTIKQVRLSDREAARRFAGHAQPVTALCPSSDGRFFASCSVAEERFVSLWDAAGPASNPSALQAFTLDGSAVSLDFRRQRDGSELYDFLAVSASGSVNVYRYDARGASAAAAEGAPGAARKPDCVIKPPAGEEVLGAHFAAEAEGAGGAVVVVRGSALRPVIQRVAYVDEASGAPKRRVKLEAAAGEGGGLLLPQQAAAAAGAGAAGDGRVRTLGPADTKLPGMAAAGLQSGLAAMDTSEDGGAAGAKADKKSKKKRKERGGAAEEEEEEEAPAPADGIVAEDEEDEEETLEDRVAALGLEGEAGGKAGAAKAERAPPRADSLQPLLVQALQSGDGTLLEQCLRVTNERVIQTTVSRLPTSSVLPFLKRVVAKFEARPTRAASLAVWIRAVLQLHTSYLVTVPGLSESLAGLYQTVDARVASFKRLLKLQGKFDLLLAQIDRQRVGDAARRAARPLRPLVTFTEGDDLLQEEEESESSEEDEDEDEDVPDGMDEDEDEEEEEEDEEEEEGAGGKKKAGKRRGRKGDSDDEDEDDEDDDEEGEGEGEDEEEDAAATAASIAKMKALMKGGGGGGGGGGAAAAAAGAGGKKSKKKVAAPAMDDDDDDLDL
eukprot:tig00000123_g6930.t1